MNLYYIQTPISIKNKPVMAIKKNYRNTHSMESVGLRQSYTIEGRW